MKSLIKQITSVGKQLFLFTILPILLLGGMPASAQEGGRMLLSMQMSADRRSAEVFVPEGYSRVVLMRFDSRRGWRNEITRNVRSGKAVFRFPFKMRNSQWRAVGIFPAQLPKRKYPDSFYQGRKSFENRPVVANALPLRWPFEAQTISNFSMDATAVTPITNQPIDTQPVEADIWKVEGSTIYFFNQLRGLQVINVQNPADPRLLACMRLPAVGEDLYLLPGNGPARELVLVTRKDDSYFSEKTLVRVVRYADEKLEIVHEMEVPGRAFDSRMIGDRLILATTERMPDDVQRPWHGFQSRCLLSQWTLRSGMVPEPGDRFELPGDQPVIAAGSDWLAAATSPKDRANASDVFLFSIDRNGLERMQVTPIRTAGLIRDQYKLQWKNHVLTAISERRNSQTGWRPVTTLENFRVWNPKTSEPIVERNPLLSSLELAAGESLFATRFAGDKAYIVTFLQTDPLWVIDLRNEYQPTVAGHLEVPGWSTYLEPIGDLLFSVGRESNTVAASLFDVANPADPKLLRRINLGLPGSQSEAGWDEKALKLLPAAGLALIPFSHYDPVTRQSKAQVQLLDVDLVNRDLVLRGVIDHQFDARRADVVNGAVISISQRELITADISNRDLPQILAEVATVWSVDEIVEAGQYLIHIDAANHWNAEPALARITSAGNTEAILAEIELGEGQVKSVHLSNGKLYVIRETGGMNGWYSITLNDHTQQSAKKVVLDVYDASALPQITRLGTREVEIGEQYQVSSAGLLWPHPHRPCVILVPQFFHYWFYSPMVINLSGVIQPPRGEFVQSHVIDAPSIPYLPVQRDFSQLLAFDVTNPSAITASPMVNIGTKETTLNGVASAADGLIVAGASDNGKYWLPGNQAMSENIHSVHVIQVAESGVPIVRPAIDLPSDLVAVTDLDRNGFLAWSRQYDWSEDPKSKITVSACNGFDAFEITSKTINGYGSVSAWEKNVVVSQEAEVKRFSLNLSGNLVLENSVTFPHRVDYLRLEKNVMIATTWNALSSISLHDSAPQTWNFPTWGLNGEKIRIAENGDLLVPFGQYGAERIRR